MQGTGGMVGVGSARGPPTGLKRTPSGNMMRIRPAGAGGGLTLSESIRNNSKVVDDYEARLMAQQNTIQVDECGVK